MKCVLIFVLLAVWISSSDASCESPASCMSDVSGLLASKNLKEYCGKFKTAMTCLADCPGSESSVQIITNAVGTICPDLNGNGNNGADALKVSALILALVLAVFNFAL